MKRSSIGKIVALSSLMILGLFSASVSLAEDVQLKSPISATDFKSFLTAVAKGVAAVIGPASILMIVVSGVLFITSGGSPERLKTAKTCLTYAIIGAVIAGSATIIVNTFLT